jgi:2-C-methyl-D-erythritol 4-phosphate cytidylyltransferase
MIEFRIGRGEQKKMVALLLFWLSLAGSVHAFVLGTPPFSPPRTAASTSLKAAAAVEQRKDTVDMADVGFVLLAGGKGSRMKANMPKQFLELQGKPVLQHSLELFLHELPEYCKKHDTSPPPCVVLVMDPMYQPDYQYLVDQHPDQLAFANPGVERQGSVENGLNKLVELAKEKGATAVEYAAIHDSARPLVTIPEIVHVIQDAKEVGAAVLGVPCKATIKESSDGTTVLRTIPRARLWEVHTPQVIKIENPPPRL